MGKAKKIWNTLLRVVAILWIVIPFLLIGMFIGVFCYSNRRDVVGLILLILFSIGGLLAGMLVLRWFSKGNRAEYIAGTNASRDIDDIVRNDEN